MADAQSDSEDSRTLVAGRKRGFEEASRDQDTSHLPQVASDEGPHKRVKGDSSNDQAHDSSLEARPVVNETSSLISPSKPEAEGLAPVIAAATEPEPSASIAPGLVSEGEVMEFGSTSVPQEDLQISAAPPKTSWNSGVKIGLRTSFGSKKNRALPIPSSSEIESVTQEAESGTNLPAKMESVETVVSSGEQPQGAFEIDDTGDAHPSLDTEDQGAGSEPRQRKKERSRSRKSKSNDVSVGVGVGVAAAEDPVEPLPFKKLKQKQILALSAEDKKAYQKAKRLHNKNDPVRIERKKNAKERGRQARLAKAPEMLARELFKDPEAATTAVAEVFARVQEWPLPAAHSGMAILIDRGYSNFPRSYDRSAKYTVQGHEFEMWPVLGDDGMPAQFEDASFEKFVIDILTRYKDKISIIQPSWLVLAFKAYMGFYYKDHKNDKAARKTKILQMLPPTSNGLSLDEVFLLAKQKLNISPPLEETDISLNGAKQQTAQPEEDDVIMLEDDDTSDDDDASSRSASSDGEIVNADLDEEQLSLQQKYFPSATGTTIADAHCLACSRVGHVLSNCPALQCISCGKKHSTFRCPERQRCSKCRERGHAKADCPEKLAVPKSDLRCDFCDSKDHLENKCHRIWRSFDPKPEEILTVRSIPIDCYNCASSYHFGPECGLYTGARPLTGGVTWSQANLHKYVDPTSDRRAVSAGVDYSIPPRKGFSIKGKANDPITFDDSDDDGESFIRPKIQTAERGHIRFSGRQDNGSASSFPNRGASPVAPYRDGGYDGGFRSEEDPRYEMRDRHYPPEPPHNGPLTFNPGPPRGGDRGGNSYRAPKRGKSNAPKGGRGRGRGR